MPLRVTVSYAALAQMLERRGKLYVSVSELASMLGISRHAAGKILAAMAREGYMVRWSRRTYKLVRRPEAAVTSDERRKAENSSRNGSPSPPPR